MGRSPCCDKVGIKKGPWSPEEDIILVSYIHEHGPGNWTSISTRTGLMRCSKSCRLRWTNYLRPGIKRGNFTPREEETIIHLQGLLGNKWSTIASYLPQRTDSDIKNYWNTHLKKKIEKFHTATDHNYDTSSDANPLLRTANIHRKPSVYASSTENISKLLEVWMQSSPKDGARGKLKETAIVLDNNGSNNISAIAPASPTEKSKANGDQGSYATMAYEDLNLLLSLEKLSGGFYWENAAAETPLHGAQLAQADAGAKHGAESSQAPLPSLEKWLLLDEVFGQPDKPMDLPAS